MPRVLDLDLDFFLDDAAHWRQHNASRLDSAHYKPWPASDVHRFLEEQCLVREPLPGFAVEHHREIFHCWRKAIDDGVLDAPFHVTHVDAHADLGLGESSFEYLMTSLLFEAPEKRRWPREGEDGLDDGSFLAFAIACRWVHDLLYVPHDQGGKDVFGFFKRGFDPTADAIQLAAIRPSELEKVAGWRSLRGEPVGAQLEPAVPFSEVPWRDFQAEAPFDFICLARSPAYTPPEADEIFEEIRHRYIDEGAI